MKKLIILLALGLFMACSATRGSQDTANSGKAASSYKIKKIVDEETFFVIYAARNDSTFKIVSYAADSTVAKGNKIKVGKSYHLELDKFFPTVPNPGIAFSWGGKGIWVEKQSHGALYNVENLNGLYLKEE